METNIKTGTLEISSPQFKHKDFIPGKFTCEGENINPPLNIKGIPPSAKSLALIMDDPDAPNGTFDHWIVWNIKPAEGISENTKPGVNGKNSYGKTEYKGPCPPEGKTHRYFFKFYALDKMLDLKEGATKKELEDAMHDHIVAQGEIVGMYQRTKYKNI